MDRIKKLKEMLETSPNDCFLWHALGLEYIKINDVKNALFHFEKALQIDENYIGTYYHLAKTVEKENRFEEAIKIYEKGIKIAIQLKDNHAKNELQMALDDLEE